MTFIAGAYSATFNALPLGTTEDGFELSFNRIQEEIRVDQYRGLVDAIHQGIDMTIRFTLTEANFVAITSLIWGWSGNNPLVDGALKSHTGQLISSFASALVLTPCAGTSADVAYNSVTFGKAVLATDPVALKFASSLRRIPITMHVLPYWSTGVIPTGYPAGSFPPCDVAMNYYSVAAVAP
jgi:hypothetical protein